MEKNLSAATESNPLSKGDNNMNYSFTVKCDAISFKSWTLPNLKGIFLADSILTLPEACRPACHDEVTNTGGFITHTLQLVYRAYNGCQLFFLLISEHPWELPNILNLFLLLLEGKIPQKKINYNIPPEEIIIVSDTVILLPIIITSEKDMASTFKGNIREYRCNIERETAVKYEVIYFTENISEMVYWHFFCW